MIGIKVMPMSEYEGWKTKLNEANDQQGNS